MAGAGLVDLYAAAGLDSGIALPVSIRQARGALLRMVEDGEVCRTNARAAWNDIQRAAEEAYDRSAACTFSSFVGYEWTSGIASNNHRNVLFRNQLVPHCRSRRWRRRAVRS